MDELYETLMTNGIEIVSETEPEDFNINLKNFDDILMNWMKTIRLTSKPLKRVKRILRRLWQRVSL